MAPIRVRIGAVRLHVLFYTKRCHDLEIDIQSGSGSLRRADRTVCVENNGMFKCFVDFCVILGWIKLRDRGIGYGTVQMYMYLLLTMRTHIQSERIGHSGHFHKLGHSAQAGGIRVENADSASTGNQIAEAKAGNLVTEIAE